MLIHLESGICESGCGLQTVEGLARGCYQSKHYTQRANDTFPFSCPTCGTVFGKMSGLFQHVESSACSESAQHGSSLQKFLRYLYISI